MTSITKAKITKGTRVLVRADFNVPIADNKVVSPFRIIKTLPTIQYLLKKGARVILISHAGDDGSQTLAPVAKVLAKSIPVTFVPTVIGATVDQALLNQKPGTALLLENLRSEAGEKKNDQTFAKTLASYADIYVNDAFPVSHRAHASLVSVPKYLPGYAGFQMEKEVKHLSTALSPKHPFLFILGGNKFSTKMPLIKKFAKTADHVFIGGALLNDLLRAKGYEVGKSAYEEGYDVSAILKNKKLISPIDVVVSKKGTLAASRTCAPYEVMRDEAIMDVGPQTVKYIASIAKISKFILWNGPIGYYEKGFSAGSKVLLKGLAESKGEVIIGGGDTVALVSKLKMEDKFTFVSTGGGATLDFLVAGTLPAIKALK
jgi:phosphoglycerate kinase